MIIVDGCFVKHRNQVAIESSSNKHALFFSVCGGKIRKKENGKHSNLIYNNITKANRDAFHSCSLFFFS